MQGNAYINADDQLHRTPLFLAASNNNCEVLMVSRIIAIGVSIMRS